ncbi:MAG: hypothetical protein RLO51_17770 [Thalassobaculum sp.]|uniref:hypothetical protein n=1 Tax=Thalassobaculum sp. TaxID=2022740 RepID=UPI0032EB3B02
MADLAAMVPDILAKTELGNLQWEEPDFNELEAILPPYKLQLKPSREGLTLTLFNADGRPIQSVVSQPLGFAMKPDGVNLTGLFEAAKRRARRVDEALAEVEQMLKAL